MDTSVASSLLTEIISILTGGLTNMASGLSSGIMSIVTGLFVHTVEGSNGSVTTTLTAFGAIVVIFAAIALALSLFRLLFSWISSLGGSRRV